MRSITIGGWVAQNLLDILVGGVLAQSAHNVGYLVVGHLAVTNSVKETKSLLEVWTDEETKKKRKIFELYGFDTSCDEKSVCLLVAIPFGFPLSATAEWDHWTEDQSLVLRHCSPLIQLNSCI